LGIYMRLARIGGRESVDLVEAELEDRFSDIPEEARELLAITRLRADAKAAGVERVVAGPAGIAVYPRDGADLDAEGLGLTAKEDCLVLPEAIEDAGARIDRAADLIAELAERS